MAEYRKYAIPHPHWADFPKNLPANTRVQAMSRERKEITPQPGLEIDEIDHIKASDGYGIGIRRYRPSFQNDSNDSLPVFLYMHPGGFVTGSLETDDDLCRAIALECRILVLSVEYRLAPEHKFPVGFEDCFSVFCRITSEAGQKEFNCDISKGFVCGGTSAGGNFASAIANLAKEQGLHQPTGLLFMASSFCHPDVRPAEYKSRILSVDEVDDAPGLTAKSIRYFAEKYGAPPEDPRYSPLLVKSRSGLAQKAYFQICGWDPRRDEAILYSQLLKNANIAVRTKIYAGLPHGFWFTCPDLSESKDAQTDTIEGVKWLIH